MVNTQTGQKCRHYEAINAYDDQRQPKGSKELVIDLEKDVGVESEVDVEGKGVDTENEGDPVVDHK